MPLQTSSTSPMQLYSLSQYTSAMLNPRWLDDLSTRTDLLTESDARKSWRFRNRKPRNLLGGAYSACAEISDGHSCRRIRRENLSRAKPLANPLRFLGTAHISSRASSTSHVKMRQKRQWKTFEHGGPT